MKKLVIILLFYHIFSTTVNSQWIQQNSGVNAQLYKVKFLNRYTGWSCGAGVILKTTNGGNNWINITHPAPNKNFYGLCILDSNTVYVTGYYETILKTTNGGQNWIEIRNGPWGQGMSYRAVFFINYNTGWIGALSQKILKTTNAGQNFIEYSGAPYAIYDLYFKDSLNGIGIDFGTGPYRTTNGGINWYYASINLGMIYPWFYNVSVINNQICFLPGDDGRIFKSTDFGDTWDSIARTSKILGTCCITFANLSTGWVGGNNHYIFKTTDSGINWIQENTFAIGVFSIYSFNELVVWGVGQPNIILHTTTGGQPFSQIANNSEQIAKNYILYQNYPNPFNPKTSIRYKVASIKQITLKVHNILGKEIATLVNEKKSPGLYEIIFNSNNLSSGIYFYSLFADNTLIDTKKMILIK